MGVPTTKLTIFFLPSLSLDLSFFASYCGGSLLKYNYGRNIGSQLKLQDVLSHL